MAIAGTRAGILFVIVLVAMAGPNPAAVGGGVAPESGDGPPAWDEAVAVARDPTADVADRRRAAAALEELALDEGYGAEVRPPAEVLALRDDLAELAGVVGRKGDDLRVRMALTRVLATESLKPLSAGSVASLLGVVADESDDPALRGAIIATLAPAGPAEPCLSAVLAAARGADASVRASALHTLERMPIEPGRCLAVAESALDDPSEPVRLAALDLVGDLADKRRPRALDVLIRTFRRGDRALRLLALVRLRALGPADAAPAIGDLKSALKDPDPRIRNKVATALADLTGDAAAYAPYLVDGLRSSDVHVWRASASDLMFGWRRGTTPDARVPALTKALGDPEPEVRGRAAVVLAQVTRHAEPYAREIRLALASGDPATRAWAMLWGRTLLRDPVRLADAPAAAGHAPRPGRRPWRVALGLGLVAVLGLGAFAWLEARNRRGSPSPTRPLLPGPALGAGEKSMH